MDRRHGPGWKKDIAVTINPLITGRKGGHYVTVKLPNGRTVGDD